MSKRQFVESFVETAAWQALDDEGSPVDHLDFSASARKTLVGLASSFYDSYKDLIERVPVSAERAGHNTALSANGHGAGWFDEGTPVARELQRLSKPFSYDIYVNDDTMELEVA